jgi:23S rRNA pseudouridine2605 synthase
MSAPLPPQKKRSPRTKPAAKVAGGDGERLQKVLAAAGIGSRRQCEELITTGRVEIDRQVVTALGTKVDPQQQEIRLDGTPLPRPKLVYYAVNKPVGVVSTNQDPAGRPRVIDLLPRDDVRLFSIGRLDMGSEGLLLVTNDGDLANLLTHPRYGVPKTYRVLVVGRPTREVIAKLLRGVHLAEGLARAEHIEIKSHHKESTILEMVLREGRNREIRRLLARVGHKVLRLVRVAVGPVRLGTLAPGATRRLTRQEIEALRGSVGSPGKTRQKKNDQAALPEPSPKATQRGQSRTGPAAPAGKVPPARRSVGPRKTGLKKNAAPRRGKR